MVLGSEGRLGDHHARRPCRSTCAAPRRRSSATCSRRSPPASPARCATSPRASAQVFGHARLRRYETRVLDFATRKARDAPATSRSRRRCTTFLRRAARLRRRPDVASRSSATRAARVTSPAAQKAVGEIVKRHGGRACVGSGRGALYDQKKFDTPYIRDFLLDRGAARRRRPRRRCRGAGCRPVYDAVMAAGHGALRAARGAGLR